MMNLEKSQAIHVGNISNLVHTASVDQGSILAVGAKHATKKGVYQAVVPATANLETGTFVLIFNDETIYDTAFKNISDFVTMDAGTILRGYNLEVGAEVVMADSLLSGTTVVGEFLIPADGSMKLTADATGLDTNFRAVVIEKTTIGFDKVAATRFRVVAPVFTDATA